MPAFSIGEIVKNGILFDVKHWRGKKMDAENIPQAVLRLFNILAERNCDFMLVGGIALLSYISGRNTQDVDLIMSMADLEAMPEIVISNVNNDLARGQFENLQIDLLLTDNELFGAIISGYSQPISFDNTTIKYATVEGLIILKLYALPSLYRQGIFDRAGLYENDIFQLLLKYPVNLAPIFQALAPHVIPSDLTELKITVDDILSRIERLKRYTQPEEND